MTSPENCDQMVEWVTGWERLGNQRPILGGETRDMIWEQDVGHQAALFMLEHQRRSGEDESAWDDAAMESMTYGRHVSDVEEAKRVTRVRAKIRTKKDRLSQLQADLDELRVLSMGRIVGKQSVTTWLEAEQHAILEDKGYAVEVLETSVQEVRDRETKAAAASRVADRVGSDFSDSSRSRTTPGRTRTRKRRPRRRAPSSRCTAASATRPGTSSTPGPASSSIR